MPCDVFVTVIRELSHLSQKNKVPDLTLKNKKHTNFQWNAAAIKTGTIKKFHNDGAQAAGITNHVNHKDCAREPLALNYLGLFS